MVLKTYTNYNKNYFTSIPFHEMQAKQASNQHPEMLIGQVKEQKERKECSAVPPKSQKWNKSKVLSYRRRTHLIKRATRSESQKTTSSGRSQRHLALLCRGISSVIFGQMFG